jgi:hypothetical protein
MEVLRRKSEQAVTLSAPQLNMFPVATSKTCSVAAGCGTTYYHINVGPQPSELFDLPEASRFYTSPRPVAS